MAPAAFLLTPSLAAILDCTALKPGCALLNFFHVSEGDIDAATGACLVRCYRLNLCATFGILDEVPEPSTFVVVLHQHT